MAARDGWTVVGSLIGSRMATSAISSSGKRGRRRWRSDFATGTAMQRLHDGNGGALASSAHGEEKGEAASSGENGGAAVWWRGALTGEGRGGDDAHPGEATTGRELSGRIYSDSAGQNWSFKAACAVIGNTSHGSRSGHGMRRQGHCQVAPLIRWVFPFQKFLKIDSLARKIDRKWGKI
jgi:hypothetical protein